MLSIPRRLRTRSAGVLLCNPFGEEAVRAHRTYRVLATQLERHGYPVLRFDYHGTGDSFGDSADTSVAEWLSDIAIATSELARAASVRRIVVCGLRLGGTLAAMAAVRTPARIFHAVLWDPIIEGRAYLDELTQAHKSYMREEMWPHEWVDRLTQRAGVPSEALGTPIGPAFGAELSALELPVESLRADNLTVISTLDTAETARLRARVVGLSPGCWIDRPTGAAWNSDAALNDSIVPMDVLQAVTERIQRISP